MSQWPSAKAKRVLAALYGIGWGLSGSQVRTARWRAKTGLILFSLFMTVRKSAPGCFPG